jgi:putative ABC transport system ATP-binding protein
MILDNDLNLNKKILNKNFSLLETVGLGKTFATRDTNIEVLKNVNIKIGRGEFAIIFGPSGCGKSTLLHCLLGLEKPTVGRVLLEGEDYFSLTEDGRALRRRHKVGVIYQSSLWIGALNVYDNIAFPLKLLNLDENLARTIINDKLEKVGMGKWANYRPTELSSGQQQKISLVRALTINPALIVADEPTGNLDTVSGKELIDIFLKLVEEGKSIVMVTHDLEYLKYGTKIFHMVDGQVVEEWSPKGKGKSKEMNYMGKKSLAGNSSVDMNVRDPDFLKKLKL